MQFQGPIKAARLIKENKETMDAIQEIGIELTSAIGTLQAFTFKHIQHVDKILQTAVPLLASIPVIGRKMDAMGLSEARDVSKAIVSFSTSAETVVREVEHALIDPDPARLKSYVGDIKHLTQNIREALAASNIRK